MPCRKPLRTGAKKANTIEIPRIIKGLIMLIFKNEDNKGLAIINKMLIIRPNMPIFFKDLRNK